MTAFLAPLTFVCASSAALISVRAAAALTEKRAPSAARVELAQRPLAATGFPRLD